MYILRMSWLVPLVVFGAVCLAVDETPCTLHASGKYFDLSPLKSSKDYEFQSPGGHTFTINVCRTPVREAFGLKDVDEKDIGGFVRRDHGDFSIGTLNTTLTIQDSRPRLTMSNGSWCKSKSSDSQIRASTVLEFVCDTSVFGSGTPRLVAQLPPGDDEDACAFVIEWRTHVACPTNEPGGAWGLFGFLVVIVLSIVVLYMVFGTLYNRYVLRLRGFDQIPQFSIASMKYHAYEGLDWLKDIAAGMHEGGRSIGAHSGFFSRPNSSSASELGLGGGSEFSHSNINPVSHQSQSHGREGSTRDGSSSSSGFVRPQSGTNLGPGKGRRGEINPVSHQAQSRMHGGGSLSSQPVPPAKKEKPQLKPLELETVGSTKEEREFMLGDDEGDDVGDALPKSGTVNATPQQLSPAGATSATGHMDNSSAALRGRDLGGGDVTRL